MSAAAYVHTHFAAIGALRKYHSLIQPYASQIYIWCETQLMAVYAVRHHILGHINGEWRFRYGPWRHKHFRQAEVASPRGCDVGTVHDDLYRVCRICAVLVFLSSAGPAVLV